MAYDIQVGGNFTNTGGNVYQLFLYVRRDQTDVANNRSTYAWELQCRFISGTNGRWEANNRNFGVHVGGYEFYPINNLDMRGTTVRSLGTGTTGWINHGADGNLGIYVRAWVENVPQFGSADTGMVLFNTDRIMQVPSATRNLRRTFVAPRRVDLAWDLPADMGGGTALEFQVQYGQEADFSDGTLVSSGVSGVKTIDNLPLGDTTYFRARTRNQRGWGAWSNVVNQAVPNVPSAPTVTRTFDAPDAVSVAWDAPATGGAAITEYELQRYWNGNNTWVTIYNGTARAYVHTPVAFGTAYIYRVRARNSQGWGPWGESPSIGIPNVPSVPGLAQANLILLPPTSLQATWTAPATNGAAILEYESQIDTSAGFTNPTSLTGTDLTDVFGALIRGTSYFVRVRARNSQGRGAWSATASYRIPTAPAPPGVPTFSDIGPTGLTVSWAAPTDSGGAAVSGYILQRSTSPDYSGAVQVYAGTNRTFADTGRTPGTQYYYRVQAQNSQGSSTWVGAGIRTLSGAYESVNDVWVPREVFYSADPNWVSALVQWSDGASWSPAG